MSVRECVANILALKGWHESPRLVEIRKASENWLTLVRISDDPRAATDLENSELDLGTWETMILAFFQETLAKELTRPEEDITRRAEEVGRSVFTWY